MIRPPGVHIAGLQLPPHMVANIPPGMLPGQRGPPPGVNMGFMVSDIVGYNIKGYNICLRV